MTDLQRERLRVKFSLMIWRGFSFFELPPGGHWNWLQEGPASFRIASSLPLKSMKGQTSSGAYDSVSISISPPIRSSLSKGFPIYESTIYNLKVRALTKRRRCGFSWRRCGARGAWRRWSFSRPRSRATTLTRSISHRNTIGGSQDGFRGTLESVSAICSPP